MSQLTYGKGQQSHEEKAEQSVHMFITIFYKIAMVFCD